MATVKKVLTLRELKKRQKYLLGELPAGALFRYNRNTYRVVTEPQFNTLDMNALYQVVSECYNKDLQKIMVIPVVAEVETL